MKFRKITLFLVSLSVFILFSSCSEEGIFNNTNYNIKNNAVITNVENAYTFIVYGDNFSASRNDLINITSDTVAITLVISDYTSGTGSFELRGNSGENLITENLYPNKVLTVIKTDSILPKNIIIQLSKYYGKIFLVVAGK